MESSGAESVQQVESEQIFQLSLSRSLAKKIADKARDEGISPQELACELLAEGLVLRAWEIMERKSTMRGESVGGYNNKHSEPVGSYNKGPNRPRDNNKGPNRPRGHHKGQKFNHNKGGGHNILDDRAAFLEYVRNQEKKRR